MAMIHFIVRARPPGQALDAFLATLASDPALRLVDTIGPPGQPHTAVVAVPDALASAFEQHFGHSPTLVIERDHPLSLFPHASATPPQRKPHAQEH